MPHLFADLTPLRVSADFRRLWLGLGVSQIGHQLTVVAVGLEAYHLTGSTFAVGVIGLCELVPLIIFGLYGGALVDQVDRRKTALIATTVMWLTTVGLAVQAALGADNLGALYVLVALQAAAFAINSPARSAIIPRLLPPNLMPAANALTGVAGNLSITIGPMLGAVLVAGLGFTAAYLVDVVLMLFALWALFHLPPILPETDDTDDTGETTIPRRRVGLSAVLEGLRYLGTQPNVRMTFLVDLCAMVFASPRVLFPAVGVMYLGGGATTTGALVTGTAVGGILASVFSGGLTRMRWQGRIIVWAVTAWGASVIAFGLVLVWTGPGEPDHVVWLALILALLTLAAAGAADTISAVFRQSFLQTATPDRMRGRLQGIFVVVVAGGPRLGETMLGANA
ncbi:MAG: MFS transporter, partial [Cellulomonadaceae bacterium]